MRPVSTVELKIRSGHRERTCSALSSPIAFSLPLPPPQSSRSGLYLPILNRASFAVMWWWTHSLSSLTEWSESERDKQLLCISTYIWNWEEWYRWTCLWDRNRGKGVENDSWTQQGKERGEWMERVGLTYIQCRCAALSRPVVSNSLRPHGL